MESRRHDARAEEIMQQLSALKRLLQDGVIDMQVRNKTGLAVKEEHTVE